MMITNLLRELQGLKARQEPLVALFGDPSGRLFSQVSGVMKYLLVAGIQIFNQIPDIWESGM